MVSFLNGENTTSDAFRVFTIVWYAFLMVKHSIRCFASVAFFLNGGKLTSYDDPSGTLMNTRFSADALCTFRTSMQYPLTCVSLLSVDCCHTNY
jgi:hypothetical protein